MSARGTTILAARTTARPRVLRALRRAGLASLLALPVVVSTGCHETDPLESIHALQSQGEWLESASRLQALVEASPEDARLQLEYGKALLAVGEATRAIWPLRRATEDEGLAREAGVLLSMALLSSMNPDDAIAAASRVLELDPEAAEALFVRSRAYVAARREEDALNDADRYVELEPDDPQGRLLQLGILVMLEQLGEAEEAIAAAAPIFEDLADSKPEEAARFCVLEGVFAWEKGDREAGEQHLEGCLTRFPEEPIAVIETVAAWDRAGEAEQATTIVRDALSRDPDRAEYRLMLAERLRAIGDDDEAEHVLREGTQRLEGPGPWLALHDFYVAIDDHAQAAEAMREALDRMSDPPAALRIAYADDLLLSGDLVAAEREAEQLPPPGVHLVRGRIHLARRDPAAARAALEEGLRLWPDNASARWLAGRAAEQMGDLPGAIAHYRESVRSDPARSPAAAELAEIYAAMGAGRDAIEFADRHLASHPEDPEAAALLLRLARRFDRTDASTRALAALAAMPGRKEPLRAEQAREQGSALAVAGSEDPAPRADADPSLESALIDAPRDPGVLLVLARALSAREPGSDRVVMLARSALMLGGGGEAGTLLGRTLVERGDFTAAIPVLQHAISSLPAPAIAQYWLGHAHESLGQMDAAREAYARSLEHPGLSAAERADATQRARAPLDDSRGRGPSAP
ncbi:MAG: tetratricopeptide repeat protein [Myxococcota bacterium]